MNFITHYTMVLSGIRVGAFDYLQWKHVTPITNPKDEVIAAKLIIYPGDPIEEYYTFCTPGIRKPLPQGVKHHEWKAAHGFRKYFKTKAEQVMLPLHVEMLLGHDTGLSMSYYRPSVKTLVEDYLNAVPLLSINYQEAILQKKVSQLQEKNEQDQYIINGRLSEKELEIELLRQRDTVNSDAIASLSDKVTQLIKEIEMLKKS